MRRAGNKGRSVVLSMTLLLAIGACGGDDDTVGGAGTGGGSDDISAPDDSDDGDGEDAGSSVDQSDGVAATLIVNGELYSTDASICEITGSGEDVEFNYLGTGTHNGVPLSVAVSIDATSDGAGGTTIVDSVAVMETSPTSVLWSTPAEGTERPPSEFSVDGKLVTYAGQVLEGITDNLSRASFVVTCA